MAKAPRLPANYELNVFINCPFDDQYQPLFYAIVFALNDLRFRPRCAKDELGWLVVLIVRGRLTAPQKDHGARN
jgi:hypothetical protein